MGDGKDEAGKTDKPNKATGYIPDFTEAEIKLADVVWDRIGKAGAAASKKPSPTN